MKLKKIIEYVVNELDDDGSIVDANAWDTLPEAMAFAEQVHKDGKSVNVEKVTRWWNVSVEGSEDIERQEEEDVINLKKGGGVA